MIDLRDEMTEKATDMALKNRGVSSKRIWHSISSEIDEKYVGTSVKTQRLSRNETCNIVESIRRPLSQLDISQKIKEPHYSQVSKSDTRSFLRFYFECEASGSKKLKRGELVKMIIWGHPDLTVLLKRRKIPIYLDATFRTVPHPFAQCLILMVFDDETDMYIPILFCLMEERKTWSYWHFLHFAVVLSDTKLNPSTITTDFEKALILACKEQFSKAHLVGCLFHFKQALRRKMKKIGISDEEVSAFMQNQQLNALTTLKKKKIPERIQKMRREIDESDKSKWDEFYKYFDDTWMDDSVFDVWNNSKARENRVEIQNRTNNALESFNKQLNSEFPAAHPNIFHFIETIKRLSSQKVLEINDKKRKTVL